MTRELLSPHKETQILMSDANVSPQDVFAREFIENQGRLYGYIAILLPHRDDAEDVLQRTSLILWQKWNQYDVNRAFLPWARGVALNEVRNFLRRSERRNVHLSEPLIEILANEIDDEDLESRTNALTYCLDQLATKQRHLLEQCYLGPNGTKAVAESLGSTVPAIYMRLHRIRKFLVECIEKRLTSELA